MVEYRVISSGSKGNAVVINREVMIDCGVPFKALGEATRELKLILMTHIHADHFNRAAVKRLAAERPTLRFACGDFLAFALADCVDKRNIDILRPDRLYPYPLCNVIPVTLSHNVPNFGYKLHFQNGKVFYATDTGNLNGIKAWHYDLYMVEANYEDEEIQKRISEKKENGVFAYEKRVLLNHLSKRQCDDFIYRNIGPSGQYLYLHQHEERGKILDHHGENIGIRWAHHDHSPGGTVAQGVDAEAHSTGGAAAG